MLINFRFCLDLFQVLDCWDPRPFILQIQTEVQCSGKDFSSQM